MNKKTIEDIDVSGKKVLVRVDFNVPLDENGNITDETRIKAALPTIKYLLEHNAAVILCSHLGRPKGEFNMKYSLAPVAKRLKEIFGEDKVVFASDVIGESAKKAVSELKPGNIVLLENLRFHKEEEKNDPDFAKALASYADIYVNDAFGTAHRAHASTAGVADYLPAVAGFLIGKELSIMGKALDNPERPFVAILGGRKVSDKIGVINNLLEKVDTLIIGGAMSYTFFKAMGLNIGNSLVEEDKLELAKQLLAKAPVMSYAVSEYVFLQADSEQDAAQAVKILQTRIDSQADGDAFYPETIDQWKAAKVLQNGAYVAMIASGEHQTEIEDAWNAQFGA